MRDAEGHARPGPPYLRIAAELRGRIESGELRPGDRLPSTRQLIRDRGVAMATATKALSLLQREGLAEAVPGVGTVVRRIPSLAKQTPRAAPPDSALTRQRIVRTGIAVADAEGLRAVSMRRVGAELGVGAMALYRHVADKEQLCVLMTDAAFGEHRLPEPGPPDWRSRLETGARWQWRIYRRHPWAAPLVASLIDPPLLPNAMAHVEWQLAVLRDLGLDPVILMRLMISLAGYVTGIALSRVAEVTGSGSAAFRRASDDAAAEQIVGSGRFPLIAAFEVNRRELDDIDALFEFGLQRQLDGIAAYLEREAENNSGAL
ncbi:TetR/AcrR family transcriptional regulator C-terminal domain-containing protein [Nocardia mexicana]|uniref:TetR family transcriptional regulator n=1 Tax=Nocardia mexicana TaxID=279262 RepID=A0A370H0F2_9NOCA|nr:TetR/AcrR family transcriptional regulator C-terminal domain-containing protein [Nocardia mexicana]RDI49013.1 TetR family transcriptional regulator [Nocardia mexicana]